MQTSAGFIWLWNGWKTTVYSDWYFPDLSKKADYGFLNLKSEKKFEKSGWNVELSLFNLLNNTEIYKKEKSAFISSEETIALRGFHAMLRIAKEF